MSVPAMRPSQWTHVEAPDGRPERRITSADDVSDRHRSAFDSAWMLYDAGLADHPGPPPSAMPVLWLFGHPSG